MKTGRNDPCPCGSGKKFKRCCMDSIAKQHSELADNFEQITAMSPNLSPEDLDTILQNKIQNMNHRPQPDFCGLSSGQMYNWLYDPIDQLKGVTIRTPADLSNSPVMRYLDIIFEQAMQNGGSFKATTKGNLPAKLVKQANQLLPEFAIAHYTPHISISEFGGSNEDKFNALHYTRILADITGILFVRKGHYHIKKSAQKTYQTQGIQAFFKPMLKTAITRYNWGYLDSIEEDINLSMVWLFMLWRLQTHANVDKLIAEVLTAFPDLIRGLLSDGYGSPEDLLSILIESRFIHRFLEFWGFVVMNKIHRENGKASTRTRTVQIQPLLTNTFQFTV